MDEVTDPLNPGICAAPATDANLNISEEERQAIEAATKNFLSEVDDG